MEYTTDRPKVSGYYWAIVKSERMVSKVYETVVAFYAPDKVYLDGELYAADDSRLQRFAGPIERPKHGLNFDRG